MARHVQARHDVPCAQHSSISATQHCGRCRSKLDSAASVRGRTYCRRDRARAGDLEVRLALLVLRLVVDLGDLAALRGALRPRARVTAGEDFLEEEEAASLFSALAAALLEALLALVVLLARAVRLAEVLRLGVVSFLADLASFLADLGSLVADLGVFLADFGASSTASSSAAALALPLMATVPVPVGARAATRTREDAWRHEWYQHAWAVHTTATAHMALLLQALAPGKRQAGR